MKRSLFRMLFAVVLSSLFLYGCSSNGEDEVEIELNTQNSEVVQESEETELNQEGNLEETDEVSKEVEQVIEEATEETFSSIYDKEISMIQDDLQIGLSKGDISELLGDQYAEFVSPLDDIVMWKYDLLTSPNYIFDAESQSDAIDFEGFFSGDIGAQLFVEWSADELTNHFVMYYVCGEEGEICEYRAWDDGTTNEAKIN
ncbi:hypothetical protein [Chengkuizengella sediminis]|uniref:hypothetical protein n=1 Tax=Chengkuizengella sediminis TaxID=1885917 RepID=UPI001389B885|nr:hypothetical protein [Chengkuizengella sediminis]NDI34493.1 hypothetical protein [Chengkuizengella sediminis]